MHLLSFAAPQHPRNETRIAKRLIDRAAIVEAFGVWITADSSSVSARLYMARPRIATLKA